MGILGSKAKIGGFLERLAPALSQAAAQWSGDGAEAAQIGAAHTASRAKRNKELAEQQALERAVMAMRAKGFSEDDIAIAMTDPGSFGSNFNERFGTQNVASGSSVVSGGPGGPQEAYYNPQVIENNAGDRISLGRNGPQEIYRDPTPKIVPVDGVGAFAMDAHTGQPYGGGGAPSGPPARAADALRANPQMAPQFDEKYGPGAAQRILNGGGASAPASRPFVEPRGGFVPPPRLKAGAMTSGRRTPEGNRLVGGVPNSSHLRGEGVDYDGADLNAVLQEVRQMPGHRKSFIHRGHVHGEGEGWNVPYFGRRGTTGLRRGR